MKKIEIIRAIRILNHVLILDDQSSFELIKKVVDLKEGSLSVGQEKESPEV